MAIKVHFTDHTVNHFTKAEIYVKSDKGFVILKDSQENNVAIIPMEQILYLEVKKRTETEHQNQFVQKKNVSVVKFKKEAE